MRTIRALPPERGGRVPAAALTAYARTEDRMQALLAGFHLHMPKPVQPAELAAVVASLAGRTASTGGGMCAARHGEHHVRWGALRRAPQTPAASPE